MCTNWFGPVSRGLFSPVFSSATSLGKFVLNGVGVNFPASMREIAVLCACHKTMRRKSKKTQEKQRKTRK